MSYLTDFRISADADATCGYVKIKDTSSYPIQTTLTRSNIAIALFWSSDEFVTIMGYDVSNTTEWWIDIQNMIATQLKAWVVNLWSATGTYNAGTLGKIVYHDGLFYYQSLAVPSGTPGSVGTTGWSLIALTETDPVGGGTIDTSLDIYNIFVDSIVTKSQDVGWQNLSIYTDCPPYTIEKEECHLHTITDNSASTITVSAVYLKRWDAVLLDDELEFESGALSIDLSIYDDGDDGVYTVEIWGQETGDTEDLLKAEIVIFDFCDTEACYKNLFKYIICKCNDPCDEECQEQYDIYERRYDLNLIWGLYHQIERYVYYDRFKYMGILTVNEERETFLSQVGRMIDKLKIIVNRCGKCTDDATNDITC